MRADLSQKDAAERLGVSTMTLYQWETGITAPRASRLPEIARLYKCDVNELLFKEKAQEGTL